MNPTPFEKWLIKHRIYCEYGMCWKPAVQVLKINNKDECRCENHGYTPKATQKEKNKTSNH